MRLARALLLVCGLAGTAAPASPANPIQDPVQTGVEVGKKWIVDEADNICGIKAAKKISDPAKVDYDTLWEATPEIKKMRKEGIKEDSPKGKALRNAAKERITKACKKIQGQKGNCGVWKAISHEDGRQVKDITSEVEALF